ncbi:flagellar brake protein [Exilibacterium tricleocarpae]|uniref:Flagellar brake protein n=1 Tax=Exilibacterium tricleocarpae TaxID=2591008 RepID=A0A545TSM2_9GAMM|nr:PilZ domain-containing protein [Exilibacterium tricleocarpae]TQV80141.1 flagellar brake protein [Exilibacterium tricleocarpae]
MNFEDLRLPYGYPVQLETRSAGGQPQRLSCRLLGCLPGQWVLVTQPRLATGTRLRSGQKMVARMMVANGISLFACAIENAATVPVPMLCLSYPKAMNFKPIRGATRVDVQLPVDVVNSTSLNDMGMQGMVADISLSGARVEMIEPIGDIGDGLTLAAAVSIGRLERRLCLKAVIRSRIERSTREYAENLPAVYGIEFTEDDDDNLLVLHGYVFSELAKTLHASL